MNSRFKNTILFLVFFLSSSLFGATHFTIRGSATQNNLGLNFQDSVTASGSIAFDLGNYFQIGVTHQQSRIVLKGYQEKLDGSFAYTEENTHTFANSLDLMIILYYGEIFVPFIQIGMVKKEYKISSYGQDPKSYSLPPVPNGGVGLGIKLNTNFSLKFSYIVSPGIRQVRPDLPPEEVLDSYSSIGISYQI